MTRILCASFLLALLTAACFVVGMAALGAEVEAKAASVTYIPKTQLRWHTPVNARAEGFIIKRGRTTNVATMDIIGAVTARESLYRDPFVPKWPAVCYQVVSWNWIGSSASKVICMKIAIVSP